MNRRPTIPFIPPAARERPFQFQFQPMLPPPFQFPTVIIPEPLPRLTAHPDTQDRYPDSCSRGGDGPPCGKIGCRG